MDSPPLTSMDAHLPSQEDQEMLVECCTNQTGSSLPGRKRPLEEVDDGSIESLRTKQFCDSTRLDQLHDSRPSTPRGNFHNASLLRAAANGPAEGQGLRGRDIEVSTDEQDRVKSEQLPSTAATSALNCLNPAPAPKQLCIRHQSTADEDKTARLQKSIEALPLADQTAVNTVWSLFSSSPHPRRALILQGLMTMCCSSQLSLLSQELTLAIRLDPFTLFPREVSFRILKHLDAMTLGRTTQVSRLWHMLSDDDLLWRNMCEQHIERKCEKCGWGLPLLSERRRRAPPPRPAEQDLLQEPSSGMLKRAVTAAANAAALQKNAATTSRDGSETTDPSPSPLVAPSSSTSVAQPTATRPWKTVYCERLAIERNWRKGRFTTKILSGHTDGIMCLQFSESLTHPSFPIVITGSYDRTARVWNMETGEELRVLKGHSRGVRCLQFDEAKLITGSMDRTLKIWNWRTGELMRTLEGHTEGIVCLHYNNDILASGSADSNVKVWNFRTGECFTLRGHTDWVNAVQLWSGPGRSTTKGNRKDDGTDSTFLFSASDDGTIRLWDLYAREPLLSYDGHVGQVQSIKLVMLDEKAIHKLVVNAAGGLGANDAETNQRREMRAQRMTQSSASAIVDAAANASGSYFARPDAEEDGSEEHDSEDNDDDDQNLSDFDRAASAIDRDGNQCGYNPSAVPGGRTAGSGSAPAIPDHLSYQTFSSGSAPRFHKTRNIPIDENLLTVQKRLYEAGLVDALPADACMADLEGPLSARWTGAIEAENSKSHHGNQRPILISASLDNTIRLWCVRTGRCIRTLFGHTEGIWSLSLDKLRIASASHDRCIKTWDTDSGMCKNTFVGHRGAVTCVQLGDDKIVSGSDDGDCRIWSFAPQSAV